MTVIDFQEYAKRPEKTRERQVIDGLRKHRRRAKERHWIDSFNEKLSCYGEVDFDRDLSEVD